MNLVMNHFEQKTVNIDHKIIGKILLRCLRKHQSLFVTTQLKNWWSLHCDGVRTILNVLEGCGVFKIQIDSKHDKKHEVKTFVKYIVPHHIRDTSVLFTNFPRISKSESLDHQLKL